MSYFSAELFARRHGGFEGLKRFVEYVEHGCPKCRHSKRRCKLKHIAEAFDLSVAEISMLRQKLMVQSWQRSKGLQEYFEFHERREAEDLEEKRVFIYKLENGSRTA